MRSLGLGIGTVLRMTGLGATLGGLFGLIYIPLTFVVLFVVDLISGAAGGSADYVEQSGGDAAGVLTLLGFVYGVMVGAIYGAVAGFVAGMCLLIATAAVARNGSGEFRRGVTSAVTALAGGLLTLWIMMGTWRSVDAGEWVWVLVPTLAALVGCWGAAQMVGEWLDDRLHSEQNEVLGRWSSGGRA